MDREYLREQFRHITPLSWAARALAFGFIIIGIATESAVWPFWVALGLIGLTIVLDWRSKRAVEDTAGGSTTG